MNMMFSLVTLALIGFALPLLATEVASTQKVVVILLGAPGSGKGTQAVRLSAQLGIPHISTGDLFRDNISRGTELGKQAKTYIDAGKLTPDTLVTEMLFDRLSNKDAKNGFLLDGYPRTMSQAQSLEKKLDPNTRLIVLNLEVSDGEVTKRLLGRKRSDDNPTVIAHRLEIFHKETSPLINHYRANGNLVEINGEQSEDQVFDAMKRAVQKPS